MDDNGNERFCASDIRDQYVVQSGSAGSRDNIGEGATDSERGVEGNGIEPGAKIRAIPSGVESGSVVGLGHERDIVASAVESV
jgi:hypothetical protein